MTKLSTGNFQTRKLLACILETPELVSAVQALEPRTLAELIRHVGLEDSGELVALATTEQLEGVLDEDLWASDELGKDEAFDADRFVLWLEVMLEGGEEFVADKLSELSEDLVVLGISRHALVIDLDELAVEMENNEEELDLTEKALDSCLYQEFDQYRVMSRRQDGFDAIVQALVALDTYHHGLLVRILERSAYAASEYIAENGGLYEVLTSEEMLEADAAAQREDRRASKGFVSPSSASSFLKLALKTPLSELVNQTREDAITRAYFRELSPDLGHNRKKPRPNVQSETESGQAKLLEILTEAEVLDAPRPALLLEAGNRRTSSELLLTRTFAELLTQNPEVYGQRMQELAYLANVLISGARIAGRAFRSFEAAEAAVLVANHGLQHLTGGIPQTRLATHALEIVRERSAVHLFRIGYHLLKQDPGFCMEELLSARRRSTMAVASERRA